MKKNKYLIIFLIILFFHIFFRFYQLDSRSPFGWDQVDNAWAAKTIIVDHKLPLVGMQAKLNSGIYIGPLYYYLITPFYFITNLDPIASGIFAGLTSIFNLLILFLVGKKIFGPKVGLISCFIYAISNSMINFDRVQWPVNFIPGVSLIIFYSLYKFLLGEIRYIFLLASMVGFSFHVHFTGVFYPLIVFLCLPLLFSLPKKKKLLWYIPLAFLIFLLFLIPNIVYEIKGRGTTSGSLLNYLNTYYHGLHLVRVIQLAKDAFIEFENFLFPSLKFLKYILPVIFSLIVFLRFERKKAFILNYLTWLWFLVPWLVFSVYSGEISNYYFSSSLFLALLIISFISKEIFDLRFYLFKILIIGFWFYFMIINIKNFFSYKPQGLKVQKEKVLEKIKRGEKIEFKEGVPESYLYYIYTRDKNK